MRKHLLLSAALGSLAWASLANAVTVTLTKGPMDPQYLAPEPADANNFTLQGITWTDTSGSADTEKGTLPFSAAPLGMGTSSTTGSTYMSVQGGGSETATWARPQTSLAVYWGSIDGDVCGAGSGSCGNTNMITVGGFTLTGKDLIGQNGVLGQGSQTNFDDNQLVTISGLGSFTTVTFSATGDSFEFSLAVPPSIPDPPLVPDPLIIPEPSTWAMMLLGFAGLCFAGYGERRRRRRREFLGTMTL